MEILISFLWFVYLAVDTMQAEFAPVLSWDVCSPRRIVVTLTGAEEGGIIYIRGYGAACRQTTSANQTQHVFDFQACGIVTGETYFTIIVQKNPLYQTGEDLQESLLCIYDLGDITVGNNVNTGDKDDDAGINKTVKPTGRMMLYKDGVDIGGQNVKLTDLLTMTIQLDEEFVDDFDIKARSCTANFIDLIQNFCASDTVLFPNFQHPTQGVITSSFGAFRTTDLGGGFVEMIFSCTVQVCRGLCNPETCADNEDGWGRKRRAASDEKYDILSIGASFSVGTERDAPSQAPDPMNSICIDNLVFILLLLALVGVLVTSLSLVVHVTTKLLKRNDELRNLTGINCRQRKSLMHVIKEQRRASNPMMLLGFNQSKSTTVSRASSDKEAVKARTIDTSKSTKEMSGSDGVKKDNTSNMEPNTDKGQIDKSSSLRDKKSNCNPDSKQEKNSLVITSNEERNDAISRKVSLTARNQNGLGTRMSPNSKGMESISAKVDTDTSPTVGHQIGFGSPNTKTMSTMEKKHKILEYHALLQRLARTENTGKFNSVPA